MSQQADSPSAVRAEAVPISTLESSDRHLARGLSGWQLYFIVVSGIVGSGWLFASLAADSAVGPASVVSWLIVGVIVIILALSWAEVSTMLPRSGGAVRYPHLTHGSVVGYLLGWAYIMWTTLVPPLEAEAVVTYASSYLKGLTAVVGGVTVLTWPAGIAAAVGCMLVFFAVNSFGVKWLGRINSPITVWKLALPAATFIFLFAVSFHPANFTSYGGFAPLGEAKILTTIVSSGIAFSLLGFRQALDFGGEARNPQRHLLYAIIGGLLTATFLYILLQLAFTGSIEWANAHVKPGDWAGLAASSWASAPFAAAIRATGVGFAGAAAAFLLADAYVSPGATGWVYLGMASRSAYGLAVNRYLPWPFRWIAPRYRVPLLALVATAVLGCLVFVPFPSWYTAVGLASSVTALTFVMSGVMLSVLRRTAPGLRRPFRLPFGQVLGPLATICATLVLYWSGFLTLMYVSAAVVFILALWPIFYAPVHHGMDRRVGVVLGVLFAAAWALAERFGGWVLTSTSTPLADHPPFPATLVFLAGEVAVLIALCYLFSSESGRREVVSAVWLLFVLFATLLLSYYGSYGLLPKPSIPFPYDSVVAAAIGLAGYLWGVRSGFATDAIQAIVAAAASERPEPAPSRT